MSQTPEVANIVQPKRKAVTLMSGGTCITNTMAALEEGVGGNRPMPRAALEKARQQAVELLDVVLATYETEVASGEVGAGGTARASTAAPVAGRCPTGLLYGRIQSGKTLGMITFAALAIDNGFRVVVVLTSDSVKLVDQTASRFSALDGIVKSSTLAANWPDDVNHVRRSLPDVGLVLVCQKNQAHLESLIDFLDGIEAAGFPALIMDDEADQATLDTTVNARTSGRPNSPRFGSTINRRTIKNDRPEELGRSVSESLRHFVMIQVTATPYALLLQDADSPLRPRFTKLLEPGEGYTGGEHFFTEGHLEGAAPLVFVPEDESADLVEGVTVAPEGLSASIAYFLVAAGAQTASSPTMRGRVQNFLCHTSQKRTEHDRLADLIRDYIDRVLTELRKAAVTGEIGHHFARAYTELQKTLTAAPSLESILTELRQRLPRREVMVVNSDGANAEFTRGLNFIVGGNILGRGLTIENLLVTYYLRSAKATQMDTMLQHARMFGYRFPIMPFTRVFLPQRLALRFHRIHTAEQHLRQLLSDPSRRSRIPVEVSEGLRATRPGVLNMGSIHAFTPGQHLYPAAPLVTGDCQRKNQLAKEATLKLGGVFREPRTDGEPIPCSFENLIKLVAALPFDPDDEDAWDPKAIQNMLRAASARFSGQGLLFCRKMTRTRFAQGALSGTELKHLRALPAPTLCVFLDVGRDYDLGRGRVYEDDFIYPSLVLPDREEMPALVFNMTE